MSSGVQSSKADPAALKAAAERWALDPAAVQRARAKLREESAVRVRSLVKELGSPIDYARRLMQHQPPPAWDRALREISPISEAHSYLIFAWKCPPLDPDAGRWCLYEAIPNAAIHFERRAELESKPSWECTPSERAGRAFNVSPYQWEMYRLYQLDVRPFWCIQGSEGGTPLHLSGLDRRYLRMMGKPDEPVPVGALPFAPWDNRVRDAVLGRDRLMKLGRRVDDLKKSGTSEAIKAQVEAEEREYRRRFWDWFGERLGPQTELMSWIEQQEGADDLFRRQTREEAIAADEARDVFIETGRIPDPVEYRAKRILVAQ